MRIDKFISECGIASRKEAARAAKAGLVTVDGQAVRDLSRHIDPEKQRVTFGGKLIEYRRFTYVMLNKPEGYVSATEDGREKTVLELLPEELQKRELFPCGRLDIDTVGLLILTDDGKLAHDLLSPKHHAEKVYRFETDIRLPDDAPDIAERGVVLDDGYECMPARLTLDAEGTGGYITLREGKFHQIKRMTHALGAETVELERVEFAGVKLDRVLGHGEWRELTEDEISLLERYRTE